jgi:hypothetical protein
VYSLVAARKHMIKRTTDSSDEDASICDAKKLKQASDDEKLVSTMETSADIENDTSNVVASFS